jgi:hypothetical protein
MFMMARGTAPACAPWTELGTLAEPEARPISVGVEQRDLASDTRAMATRNKRLRQLSNRRVARHVVLHGVHGVHTAFVGAHLVAIIVTRRYAVRIGDPRFGGHGGQHRRV